MEIVLAVSMVCLSFYMGYRARGVVAVIRATFTGKPGTRIPKGTRVESGVGTVYVTCKSVTIPKG